MATPPDVSALLNPSTDPADVLLDAEAVAARFGLCFETARRLYDLDGFPFVRVSERRVLTPLLALRHWELSVSLPAMVASPAARMAVLAPPAHGRPGRPRRAA